MTDQNHLDRINALTTNAQQTWFALLAALVFVGITLMGVEHIDFYGVDRATDLPLVNVEVPTRFFFVAAPILIAAIYGYFHLYLIRLWDALGAAPARLNGIRLGDAVAPWLVSDAALHYRAWKRDDNCTTPRALEGGAMLLNLLLAWGFGLFVLAALWWVSMPARIFWMTGLAGLSLFVSLLAGGASLAAMVLRLRDHALQPYRNIFATAPPMAAMIALIPFLAALSFERTSGSADRLAPLDLSGENIVERPADWLSFRDARSEFRADWCTREMNGKNCFDFGDRESEFDAEFIRRRAAFRDSIRKPMWHNPTPAKSQFLDFIQAKSDMDFRQARLQNSFLVGVNLSFAKMEGANLIGAQMEGATVFGSHMDNAVLIEAQMQEADLVTVQMEGAYLIGAQMEGARLRSARMERANLSMAEMRGADLSGAEMQRADLFGAQMYGADLSYVQMQGAYLRGAEMQGADLSNAQMQGADLNDAQMQGADLSDAQMQGADLRRAQMEGATLSFAQIEGAMFDFSKLSGTPDAVNVLVDTNLSGSVNNGGMLRFVDLTPAQVDAQTDFRNVFLDGSVTKTPEFRAQMDSPCQWIDRVIEDDAELYGRWRGWIEAHPHPELSKNWPAVAPQEFRDVTPIPPPPGCTWKTGPMPGAAAE